MIQKALREDFSSTTVIAIAHRLATISSFDKILVVSDGELVEFDSPKNLLENEKSAFFELVQATGPAEAQAIKDIAFASNSI